MTQWVKALNATPDNLCSIPRTYTMEEENQTLTSWPLMATQMLWHVCHHPPLHKYTKIKNVI